MKIRNFALLSSIFVGGAFAAEPADLFSRANCFNNESITYNYFDPPQWRAVFSWHFQSGDREHYVTPNPTVVCFPGTDGYTQINGLYCTHDLTYATRHAGVHGAFLSTEPNPDGNLTPGFSDEWRTEGVHSASIPGIGWTINHTAAEDCNLHFDQFY